MKITKHSNVCILTILKDNISKIDHLPSHFLKEEGFEIIFDVSGQALKAYGVCTVVSVDTCDSQTALCERIT